MFIKLLVFHTKLTHNQAFSSSKQFKKDLYLHILVTKIKAFN